MIYIAYGTNLNKEQMEYKCSNARCIGTSTLEGYELVFRGRENNAYASIEPRTGSSVPVAIFDIDIVDEASMDRYEEYPNFCYKEIIPFVLHGQEYEGMVYRIHQNYKMNHPSADYVNVIRQGYGDCDLDELELEELLDNFNLRLKNKRNGIRMP